MKLRKRRKKIDLALYFPAGYNFVQEITWNIAGFVCSFLYAAFLFQSRSSAALDGLYYPNIVPKKMIPGKMMPDFAALFDGCLMGFFILMAGCILWAVAHYRYHYQGSKSIYLMRRLPDSRDLWRRCITAPAVTLILAALAALITLLFFFGVYHAITPETALKSGQWHRIWN